MSSNSKTPTSIEQNPVASVHALMVQQKDQIAMALPKHLSPDRFLRIALTEIRKNPELGMCDKLSFLGAVIQSAQLGLEPGNALGHAYLVPFNNRKKGIKEVVFITGYRGYIDLARRSGQIESLVARLVYEKDEFKYTLGDEERIHHVPSPDADRGKITHCYAVARLRGGAVQREVMSRAQLDAHKERFSKGNPVWETDFDEMCRKTLIRRLAKYLPLSPEMSDAIRLDDSANTGEGQANWEILDPDHQPKLAHDPQKILEAQSMGRGPDPVDLSNAQEEFQNLCDEASAYGISWKEEIKIPPEQLAKVGPGPLRAASEILRNKIKAAPAP